MTELTETLDSLHDTDVVTAKLTELRQGGTQDAIDQVNLDALAKRRRDLERRLGAHLRADQLDLIEYKIETAAGAFCPSTAVAHALLAFQEMTSCAFDAVRTAPKRLYQPSRENLDLSTFLLTGARVGSLMMMSLSVPNQRLIAIESDLDIAFELVFSLLRIRTSSQLISVQARTGAAALTLAYGWARNSIEYGLTTFISWQKNAAISEAIAILPSDAELLRQTIEDTSLERTDEITAECELLSLDNASSSFVLRTTTGEERAGQLANRFPRGAWAIYARYTAQLTRMIRIRCATGEEAVRWMLNELTPV
jgi:hypothetical protein